MIDIHVLWSPNIQHQGQIMATIRGLEEKQTNIYILIHAQSNHQHGLLHHEAGMWAAGGPRNNRSEKPNPLRVSDML